jgi:hypothetical protein
MSGIEPSVKIGYRKKTPEERTDPTDSDLTPINPEAQNRLEEFLVKITISELNATVPEH